MSEPCKHCGSKRHPTERCMMNYIKPEECNREILDSAIECGCKNCLEGIYKEAESKCEDR